MEDGWPFCLSRCLVFFSGGLVCTGISNQFEDVVGEMLFGDAVGDLAMLCGDVVW